MPMFIYDFSSYAYLEGVKIIIKMIDNELVQIP